MNLPPYPDIRIRERRDGQGHEVLDPLRRRYVRLTGEEWVRQHFVHHLTANLGYPPALMANEVETTCGTKRLRIDTIVYTHAGQPLMIIEYKAERVPITQRALNQAAAYNTLLAAPYLAISNGQHHLVLERDEATGQWHTLPRLPRYQELRSRRES